MAITFDGSAVGTTSSASPTTGSFTTSSSSGVMYILFMDNSSGITVSSFTGPPTTPTVRAAVVGANGNTTWIYACPYTSTFSGTIAANLSGSGGLCSIATVCFGGANTSLVFDPPSAGTDTSNGSSSGASITTTSGTNNGIVFVSGLTGSGSDGVGSGWNPVAQFGSPSNYFLVGYQINPAGLYTATSTSTNMNGAGSAIDAITQATVVSTSPPTLGRIGV